MGRAHSLRALHLEFDTGSGAGDYSFDRPLDGARGAFILEFAGADGAFDDCGDADHSRDSIEGPIGQRLLDVLGISRDCVACASAY